MHSVLGIFFVWVGQDAAKSIYYSTPTSELF